MIRANDMLIFGGESAASDSKAGDARSDAVSGRDQGGVLHIASSGNGDTLGDVPLESPPVWDGISAARGRLYVAQTDGSVVCLD